MASSYPAEFLGVSSSRGAIAPGLRADFVELAEDLSIGRTWVGGRAS
jgi:N-acetylglucosamine-6-phosphate deacetylase